MTVVNGSISPNCSTPISTVTRPSAIIDNLRPRKTMQNHTERCETIFILAGALTSFKARRFRLAGDVSVRFHSISSVPLRLRHRRGARRCASVIYEARRCRRRTDGRGITTTVPSRLVGHRRVTFSVGGAGRTCAACERARRNAYGRAYNACLRSCQRDERLRAASLHPCPRPPARCVARPDTSARVHCTRCTGDRG